MIADESIYRITWHQTDSGRPRILGIETSSGVCSVAANDSQGRAVELISRQVQDHAVVLTRMIEDTLGLLGVEMSAIDAFALSAGPGSYTGLRIGVATAKGICFALSIPLIAVPTLQALAHRMRASLKKDSQNDGTQFVSLIDARRMEVYAQRFDKDLTPLDIATPRILDSDFCAQIEGDREVYFGGSGARKAQDILEGLGMRYLEIEDMTAFNVLSLAQSRYEKDEFEEIGYFEPIYLKEFVAIPPRNPILPSDGASESAECTKNGE